MIKRLINALLLMCISIFMVACSNGELENGQSSGIDNKEGIHMSVDEIEQKVETTNTKPDEATEHAENEESQKTDTNNAKTDGEQAKNDNGNANDESDVLDYLETVDEYLILKDFWEKNQGTLEKAFSEMKELEIDFFINDVPFAVDGTVNKKVENVTYTDSINAVLQQCSKLNLKSIQFGWSETPRPVFNDNALGYFYLTTSVIKDSNGNRISLELVYSENAHKDIYKYTAYLKLSDKWLLVLSIYE